MTNTKSHGRKAKTRRKAHALPWYRKMKLPFAETAWALATNCAAGWVAASIH